MMSMSMGILPEKRSAEATTEDVKRSRITHSPQDSHLIYPFAQRKVIGHDNNVSGEEDSDDEMYLDSPDSIGCVSVTHNEEKPQIFRHKDIPEETQERKGFPAHWVSYCHICKEMSGHYTHVCPYRCVAFYEDDRCFKKVHNDGIHFYRSLAEPSGSDESFF